MTELTPAADLVGSTVRSIRLIGRLGAGGMGEVFLGFDERLERRVAVKAIRGDRMHVQAKARFLREARVLSQLEHPNICRLYDLIEEGETDFLVLELVQGSSLRQLGRERLPFARAVDVCVQIADALTAAHAMSVVHRDLKPENVMVTAEGQVKVLDFGLARPVSVDPPSDQADAAAALPRVAPVESAEDDEQTAFLGGGSGDVLTLRGEVLGTPRYMSPEQARGELLTAASDVYSLGLVMQELFTGRGAYGDVDDPGELHQRSMWGDSEPVRDLDVDLAALIERMKALSPGDRPTAGAAAERLRWIAAKPRRRARRIARAAVIAALSLAAAVSTAGLVQARRAQSQAETSERLALRAQAAAEAVNLFLRDMLTSADPARRGRDVKVLDVLDWAAENADADFAAHPANRAAVLDTLGRTYQELGELDKGHELLSRALNLRRSELGPQAPETLASMHSVGRVLLEMDRKEQAESVLRETLELRESLLGPDRPETLETVAALGRLAHGSQRLAEAEAFYRRAFEGRQRVLGADDRATLSSMRELGMVLRDQRRLDEAEPLLRESYERSRALFGVNVNTVDMLHSLARLTRAKGEHEKAAGMLRDVVTEMGRVRGRDHPATLKAAMDLGRTMVDAGRVAEGEALLHETLAAQRQVIGPAHRDTLETMRGVAYAALKQGRKSAVDRIFLERYRIASTHLGESDPLTMECKSVVANTLRDDGSFAQAEPMYRQVLEVRRRLFGEDHVFTQTTKRDLVKLLRASGRGNEADALDSQLPAAMRTKPAEP